MPYDLRSSPERRTRPQFNPNASAPRHTFTMDDETNDHLARAAATVEVSPCELLDRSVFLDGDVYERLTNMATQARANEGQFLEHLILRAEAIYNFQPPLLSRPRPWWKLWGKDPEPDLPAIVADLRTAA